MSDHLGASRDLTVDTVQRIEQSMKRALADAGEIVVSPAGRMQKMDRTWIKLASELQKPSKTSKAAI